MATYKNVFTSSQEDTTIITPSSGKKILIWRIIANASNGVTIEFLTSNKVVISGNGSNNGIFEGAEDEVLSINCGTGNTEVIILYDEI